MDIGWRMKEARKIKGFTVAHMADLMGVTQPTITRWENGTIDIPSSVLIRYINALGLTPAEFFSEQLKELPPEIRQVLEKIKKLSPRQLQVLNTVLDEWKIEDYKAEEQHPIYKHNQHEHQEFMLHENDVSYDIDLNNIVLVAEAEGREEMRPLSPELQAIVKDAIKASRHKRKKETKEG
ncbi:Helix-turn-helix domain protein [Pelotomaculum sp. FP]|nr:Helix-turn-helix domain protein [Pelotomaculum sp. FP]